MRKKVRFCIMMLISTSNKCTLFSFYPFKNVKGPYWFLFCPRVKLCPLHTVEIVENHPGALPRALPGIKVMGVYLPTNQRASYLHGSNPWLSEHLGEARTAHSMGVLAISDNFLAEKRGSLGVKLQKIWAVLFYSFFWNFCCDLQTFMISPSNFYRKSKTGCKVLKRGRIR